MITRRELMIGMTAVPAAARTRPQVAITMDDVNWRAIPQPFAAGANARLLRALSRHGRSKAALFVVGANIDNETGRAIVQSWSDAGHLIGNHTWSHRVFGSKQTDEKTFEGDILRCERAIDSFQGFRKYFRFPALKEGASAQQRDSMRSFLNEHGYRNGHVTIDASDWYYDSRLRARLAADPRFDVNRFRRPYLDHIWQRTVYYDGLARRVLGRSIPHTLLIHYNLLNALFLADLLSMYRVKGWAVIDAVSAYSDPVFHRAPRTVPAGESLVWALAKEDGRFDAELRYPGESDEYEKPVLDRLGL
jgi:peptidoglycan/xylan/chitin deacetylase (PgdA/CDA1 family)